MKLPTRSGCVLAAALLLAACATPPAPPVAIPETAARLPELGTLHRLLGEAGLADTLRGPGPYTVFAPSDAAFKAVPEATMKQLASDRELLRSVLTYHVVAGKVASGDVRNGNVKTVQGANVALARAGSYVTVEDAMVTQPDVDAANGVVHVIDRVLIPPRR